MLDPNPADCHQNTDRAETIRILSKLYEVSTTTYQKIRLLLALVPARLEYSQSLVSMPHNSWVSCMHEFDSLVTLLIKERDYVVEDTVEEYDDMVDREPQTVNGVTERVKVIGNVVGLMENLDNEVCMCSITLSLLTNVASSSRKLCSTPMLMTKGPTTSNGFERSYLYTSLLSKRRFCLKERRRPTRLFELSCAA